MDTEYSKSRSFVFDNYKCLLIVLVVFGHVLEEYGIFGTSEHIRAVIYSFHMPAFVFISGYFSKNVQKSYDMAFEKCLLPFILFNTVWLVMSAHSLKVNVLYPAYVFWYLMSLFFWRISLRLITKIRFVFLLLVLLALYAGCFHEIDRFLSVSRTLVFWPMFYLGFWFSEEKVEKLRSRRKTLSIAAGGVLAIAFSVTLWLNRTGRIPVKTYENLQCYHCSGIGNAEGVLIRFFEMGLAILIVFALLILMPDKKYRFTCLGERTLTIYLLSGFFIYILRVATDRIGWTAGIQSHDVLLLSLSILACIGIVFICSREWVCRLYERFFSWLGGLFLKSFS